MNISDKAPKHQRDDDPDVQARLHGTQTETGRTSRRKLLAGIIGGAVLAGGATAFGIRQATQHEATPASEPTVGATEKTGPSTGPTASESEPSVETKKPLVLDTEIHNLTYEETQSRIDYDALAYKEGEDIPPEDIVVMWGMLWTKAVNADSEYDSSEGLGLIFAGEPPANVVRQNAQLRELRENMRPCYEADCETKILDEHTLEMFQDVTSIKNKSATSFTAETTEWIGLNTKEKVDEAFGAGGWGDEWGYKSGTNTINFKVAEHTVTDPKTKEEKTVKLWSAIPETAS